MRWRHAETPMLEGEQQVAAFMARLPQRPCDMGVQPQAGVLWCKAQLLRRLEALSIAPRL